YYYKYKWSTGATIASVSVKPGTYSVMATDTVSGNSITYNNLLMWHGTWQLTISAFNPPSFWFDAMLPNCGTTIYTSPSCAPLPADGSSLIVWEDSVP